MLSLRREASSMKYRPEIDGLRALAVIAVVFYHGGVAGFRGGFVGVDVFFVISGFLITSLILTDVQRGEFSLLGFWERRARRILPALLTVVLVALAVGLILMVPEDFETLSRSAIAQSVFASNIFFWREAGYFGPTADELPLLHTWSLAVEEQFYLLFPVSLFLISRYALRLRWIAVAAAVVVSLLISIWAIDGHETSGFYLLPSRAWELGVGALVALWALRYEAGPSRALAEAASVLGLLLIGVAVFGFSRTTPFPGYAAALPVVGTALLIWSNTHAQTGVAKVLSLRPCVAVGLISYSLYLWHYPLLVFASYPSGSRVPPLVTALLIAASFVLAYGSWRYVETPFRQRRILATRKAMLTGAASALVVAGALGIAAESGGHDLASRINPEAVALADSSRGSGGRQEECNLSRPVRSISALCIYGDQSGSPGFILWGDSHARALLPAMDALAEETGITGVHASSASCPPIQGWTAPNRFVDCQGINRSIVEVIHESEVKVVVLAASWVGYFGVRDPIPTSPATASRSDVEVANDGPESDDLQLLAESIRSLMADGVEVWLVRDVPRFRFDPPRRVYTAALLRRDVHTLGQPYSDYLAAMEPFDRMSDLLQEEGVNVVDLPDLLCESAFCPVVKDGVVVYADNNHLSVEGALLIRSRLLPLFDSLQDE
jgi:peptidoglycan/LPS O-acetylase OafA/YrhL